MEEDKLLQDLGDNDVVAESYVLVREVKVYLDVSHTYFHPRVFVKLWKSLATPEYPFNYTISHHVHTPTQVGPYYPSITHGESELEVLNQAIDATVSFLRQAIDQGYEPSDDWLVADNEFRE